MTTKVQALSDAEKEILYEIMGLACQMANSIQADVEENPDAASNTTLIIVNEFCDKMDVLNEMLEGVTKGNLQ